MGGDVKKGYDEAVEVCTMKVCPEKKDEKKSKKLFFKGFDLKKRVE